MVALLRTKAQGIASVSGSPYLFQQVWQPGTGGGSTADATDCLARYSDFWTTLAAKIATGVVIVFDPVCEIFDSATGDLTGSFTGVQPANINSSAGSSPLPAQVQGLIAWSTPIVRNGRFLRGRTYVPLPDEGDNAGNATPSVSYTAQLTVAVGDLLAAGSTASAPHIWGRPTTVGGSNGVSGPISAGVARNNWATQRRRAV